MEGLDLNAYADSLQSTIRLFAAADVDHLRCWQTTDVPGFNKQVADFFYKEYGVQTGYDLVEWFDWKCGGIVNLRVRMIGYIPRAYWNDAENKGDLELICHTMQERKKLQELYHYNKIMIDAFEEVEEKKLYMFGLVNMYGCNDKMADHLHSIGIHNGGQLYKKYRELGHHYAGMRDWLSAHIPEACLQDEKEMGNLDHICIMLEARAKRQNARGDRPPAASPPAALLDDKAPAFLFDWRFTGGN